ncbi:MAG: DUF2726 domain-containing protein [bacterium]|nr:DUF2726 domain-containing protein [bacterium]
MEKEMANYQKIAKLFTKAENRFFHVLEEAVGNEYRIYGKIRIADAIKPNYSERTSEWHTYFNKIKAKHFDFVLCDKETNEILCVIELNDRTHFQKARGERDRFIDEVCREIKLPLLFITNKNQYNTREVKNIIYNAIGKKEDEFEFTGIKLEKDRIIYRKKTKKIKPIEVIGWAGKTFMVLVFLTVAAGIAECSRSVSESSKKLRERMQTLNISPQTYKKPLQSNKTENTNKIHCWLDENGKTVYSNVEPINKNLMPCE